MEVVQEGRLLGPVEAPAGRRAVHLPGPLPAEQRGRRHRGAPDRSSATIGSLKDMPRSGAMSACCGTAGWVNCDHTAKRVQMERLNEAEGTGADTLITACPKCLIHLSCADRHHGAEMPRRISIDDIHVRAARALEH